MKVKGVLLAIEHPLGVMAHPRNAWLDPVNARLNPGNTGLDRMGLMLVLCSTTSLELVLGLTTAVH